MNKKTTQNNFFPLIKLTALYCLLFFFTGIYNLNAQCPPGNVTLNDQQDVDGYVANYPTCSTIAGALTIGPVSGSSDIDDISGLSNLTAINSFLTIRNNPLLTDISALDGVGSVTAIWIDDCDALVTLDNAFQGVSSLSGSLIIEKCALLSDISGLNSVTTIGGELSIKNNGALASLASLNAVTAIGDDLEITVNPGLTELNHFNNLTTVNGWIQIEQNTALNTISGFSDLTTVDGNSSVNIHIVGNSGLTDVSGFDDIAMLDKDVVFRTNAALTDISGFGSLTSIGGGTIFTDALIIENNDALVNITGFPMLNLCEALIIKDNAQLLGINNFNTITTLWQEFTITNNDAIQTISIPNNNGSAPSEINNITVASNNALTAVNGTTNISQSVDVTISNNPQLSDLSGFAGITSISGDLMIWNNPSLISLSGLSDITFVNDKLTILSNNGLTNLNGLTALEWVTDLLIEDNSSLQSLGGLNSFDEIKNNGELNLEANPVLDDISTLANTTFGINASLLIEDNTSLSVCDIQSICDFLGAGGTATINNNDAGCNSVQQVSDICNDICTWTNGTGNNQWNDAGNWSCGMVPGADTEAVFGMTAGQSVVLGSNVTFQHLTIGEGITILGNAAMNITGTLTKNGAFPLEFDNTITVSGTVELNAGSLGSSSDSGSLIAAGTFNWNGGNLFNHVTINSGATMNILTGATHSIFATLTNEGIIEHLAGNVRVNDLINNDQGEIINNGTYNFKSSGAAISLYADAVFDNQGTFDASVNGSIDGGCGISDFENAGTFAKSGGVGNIAVSVEFENTGILDIQAGGLDFTCSFDLGGTILASVPTTIQIASGALRNATTLNSHITLRKTGAGTYTLNAPLTIEGNFETFAGTVDGTAELNIQGILTLGGGTISTTGNVEVENGTVNVVESSSVNNLNLTNTTVNQNAPLTLGGGLSDVSSTFECGAVLNVTNQFSNLGTFNLNIAANGAAMTGGANFNNQGTFEQTTTANLTFTPIMSMFGTWTILGQLTMNSMAIPAGNINIDNGANLVLTTSNIINGAVFNFTGTGKLTKQGASETLNINTSLALGGHFDFQEGTVAGSGNLTLSSQMTWQGGTLSVPTTIAGSGNLTLSGAAQKDLSNSLTINGMANHCDGLWNINSALVNGATGTIDQTGGTFNLNSGGSMDNTGTYDWKGGGVSIAGGTTFTNNGNFSIDVFFASLDGSGTFDNNGTFASTGSLEDLIINLPFINDGTFTMNGYAPHVAVFGSFTQNGSVNLNDETFLQLQGGGSINAAFIIDNFAGVDASGGNLHVDASLTVGGDGSMNVSGANVSTSNGSTIVVDGSFMLFGGTLDVPTTINAGGTATLGGFGTVTLTEAFVNNGMASQLFGMVEVNTNGSIENGGQYDWNGGQVTLAAGTTFTNTGNLEISVNAPPPPFPAPPFDGQITGAGTFINNGTLENALTDPPFGTTFLSGFLNGGALRQTQSTTSLSFAGSFENQNAGSVEGVGIYDFLGGLTNNGSFAPGNSPGILTVNTFDNTGGELNIEISPTNPFGLYSPGVDFDLLNITGAATLNGTLNVTHSGDTPPAGTSFVIMTATGFSGSQFGTVNLPNNSDWSITYNADNVVIGFQTVLPVELTDFKAEKEDDHVLLNWQTLSELNNRGFFVERSADGWSWGEIGFVEGRGNSSGKNNYLFKDENPLQSMNYYRLRQVDIDGHFSFSKIINVVWEKELKNIFEIYPNPVSGNYLSVFFKNIKSENGELILINNIGQIIKKEKIELKENKMEINYGIKNIPAGQYFIFWQSESGRWMEKILIE
ncbi:MAG: T9SS type A sorting domain-containing protein [Bacteroidota bacterium]